MNFKALTRKTNPNPEPKLIQNASPDPNSRIQKFIHYMATPQRRLHRVTIRNHLRGLAGRGGPDQRSKLTIRMFAK